MSDTILTGKTLEKIKEIAEDLLISTGIHTALVIDDAGNIIIHKGSNKNIDSFSLAALAAANFGATAQIAQIVGAGDFSLLYHKGEKENIHFTKIGKDFILVSIFESDVALGAVRLKTREFAKKVMPYLG